MNYINKKLKQISNKTNSSIELNTLVKSIDSVSEVDYKTAVKILKNVCKSANANNNKELRLALLKEFKSYNGGQQLVSAKQVVVPVRSLMPTQNVVSSQDSLYYPCKDPELIRSFFNNETVKIQTPIVICGKYIIDGHSRWSELFLINPDANIKAIDLGFSADTPSKALKLIQLASAQVAVKDGDNLPLNNSKDVSINILHTGYYGVYNYVKKQMSEESAKVLYSFIHKGEKDELMEDFMGDFIKDKAMDYLSDKLKDDEEQDGEEEIEKEDEKSNDTEEEKEERNNDDKETNKEDIKEKIKDACADWCGCNARILISGHKPFNGAPGRELMPDVTTDTVQSLTNIDRKIEKTKKQVIKHQEKQLKENKNYFEWYRDFMDRLEKL